MAFENRSTITRRASHPFEVGSPVTISTEMWVQGPLGYGVRMERGGLGLRARFRTLTDLATFDIGFNGLLHLRPPVLPEDQLLCFLNAWVSGGDVIMELGDDFATERMPTQDVDASVILQKSALSRHSSFVGEGRFYPLVPKLFLSSGSFNFGVNFIRRGHEECSEMGGGKHGDIAVVVLPLIMVVAAGQ